MTSKAASNFVRRASLVAAATLFAIIPVAAAVTQNQADFINQMYADLLKRPADGRSCAPLAAMLMAGATRAQVAAVVTGGAEFRTLTIEGYFQTYLQRPPSAAEISFGVDLLGKLSEDGVQATVLGGEEYFRRAGDSNSAFVQRMYQDVLNRPPTPVELRDSLELIALNQSRMSIAAKLLGGVEHQRMVVASLYRAILRRPPTAAELDKVAAVLLIGLRESFVIDLLVGSEEYLKFAVQAASHTVVPCI